MADYISTVLAVSLAASVGVLVLYRGEADKAARAGISVIVLSVILSPVVSFIGGDLYMPELDADIPTEDGGVYFERAEEAFREGVSRYVADEFSLSRDDIRVFTEGFVFESMTCKKIKIILSGRAAYADSRRIEQTVKEAGLGECEVTIELS